MFGATALAGCATTQRPSEIAYDDAPPALLQRDPTAPVTVVETPKPLPGQITDIALQPGEALVGSGPVAAGDTVRWIIGDTESGTGAGRRVHILIKPTRPELVTNLVINTDRRTYHMELRALEKTYMASVSWQYSQDQLIALHRQNAEAEAAQPVATGVDLANVNFRYAIEGDRALALAARFR
ncbi:Conjugative transfer protein TrbG [Candidatus Paraburkholderia calva]|nr:Conjugative transfer protein TrbG [Candidatus Paraburkholderia calva]